MDKEVIKGLKNQLKGLILEEEYKKDREMLLGFLADALVGEKPSAIVGNTPEEAGVDGRICRIKNEDKFYQLIFELIECVNEE